MDASVVTALFVREARSPDARSLAAEASQPLLISNFAAVEVASAVSRKVRMEELTTVQGQAALAGLDRWMAGSTDHVLMSEADLAVAERLVRRFELKLRTVDAIHVALAQRLGAELATFDTGLASGGRAAGLTVHN